MKFRHCIITEEFSGVNRSGGIGACSKGLAGLLIRQGYTVDVLITDLSLRRDDAFWINRDPLAPNFILLQDALRKDKAVTGEFDSISKAFYVYRFLKERQYDVVHFNDWMGSGFYCAMARRQGIFKPHVVTHLHGGSEWVRRHNLHFPEIEDYEREAIERSQIENSDEVISPSQYLLDYYHDAGLTLPNGKVQNWVLPQWNAGALAGEPVETRPVPAGSINELIFFGRHERRKGFELFVEAVARLSPEKCPNLTFIGRFDRLGHEFTGSHVFRKLATYGGRIRFLDKLDQEQALSRILHSRSALCVMPSLIENSPCVVGECLTIGAPFLATDVGGIAELIAPESREHCLVSPNPRALAQAIERCLEGGLPAIRASFVPRKVVQNWINWLESLEEDAEVPSKQLRRQNPLVSVCIAHYERPQLLSRAIQALMAQTYENIEIIVTDDGSKRADAIAYLQGLEQQSHRFPIKVIWSENRYLGAARNLAASKAKGEYILFQDDDNFAEPNEIEIFTLAAQHSGCEIITCQYWVLHQGEDESYLKSKKMTYFPIGIGGVFSFFRNRFGDANAFFKRSTFEALGGFSELRDIGWEDWEIFLKAYLRGIRMGVVPEPLFNYHVNPNGMLATGNALFNNERLFAMVDREQPRLNADLLRYAQRHAVQQQVLDQTWSALEKFPEFNLHQQLMAEDPASPEARAKLADIAFALGRIADAIEIGAGDLRQRTKMLALMTNLANNPATVGMDEVVITPDFGNAIPVILLTGWAFEQEGIRVVPQRFLVDGVQFEMIAHLSIDRPDVAGQFGLADGQEVGFWLVAKREPKKRGWRDTVRSKLRLGSTQGFRIELLDHRPALRGHVDDVFQCSEITLNVPRQRAGRLFISVATWRPDKVLLRSASQVFAWATRTTSTSAIFDVSSDVGDLTFILPPDPDCTITIREL